MRFRPFYLLASICLLTFLVACGTNPGGLTDDLQAGRTDETASEPTATTLSLNDNLGLEDGDSNAATSGLADAEAIPTEAPVDEDDPAVSQLVDDAPEAADESQGSTSDEPVAFPEGRPVITAKAGSEETYNNVTVGFTEDGHPYMGSLNAPVVIQEYSDFECPFCSRFHSDTLVNLMQNEIANGQALFLYYDFPLSIHPQAPAAANAARCAGEQGAASYWAMHDTLFETLGEWSVPDPSSAFISYADAIGLDTTAFGECIANAPYDDAIAADLDAGTRAGIRGTPGFLINGQPLSGAQPYGVFANAISRIASGETVAEAPPQAVDPSEIEVEVPQPFDLSDNVAGAMGDPNAPVTIVEFSDYQCPFCSRHSADTMPQLIREYVETGRIYYVMKDLPLDQIHPLARQGAAAARCAGQQEAYWEMHDILFEQQGIWDASADLNAAFVGYAESLQLDIAAFESCLADPAIQEAIEENVQEARTIGIGGTPFFFVQGFPVINGAQPIDVFNQVIELAESDSLVEAIMDAQRRQIAAQQQQAQQQQAQQPPEQPSGPVDVPIDGAYAIGDPNAPVTIVEYTDYQCPFCQRHHLNTFAQLVEEYVDTGKVYYVFKDFPLNFHPQAEMAAVAARCAGDQERFLEMHTMLFETQSEWNGRTDAAELFSGYAADLALDSATFDSCLNSNDYAELVQADLNEGAGFGVRGTPAFFINGQLLSGAQPYQVFQQAIDASINP